MDTVNTLFSKSHIAFVYGVLFTALGMSMYSAKFTRLSKSKQCKANTPTATSAFSNQDTAEDFPVELKQELLSRTQSYFGEENFRRIEGSFVIVVGTGGVGSHAANMLVRSGVGRIRIIDFDQVSLSSLNRHAIASLEDVGTSKVETMKSKLSKICPWCTIEAIPEMYKESHAERLLAGNPDYVLDCIDDINTKGHLIAYCVKNGLKVLTSMGAGAKADPTKLRIAPLVDCVNDPLASKIKWKLKKFGVSADEVMAVFSIEKPTVDLLPLDDDQANSPQDYGAVDYFRIRVMPVLGTSPSIFGQAMASYVLSALAGMVYNPSGFDCLSKKVKEKMRVAFRREENERFNNYDVEDLHDDDLEFIINTVWRARCVVTGKRFFGPNTLTLTRWNPDQPPVLENLVLLARDQSKLLAERGREAFSTDIVKKIEDRLEWAKDVCSRQWEEAVGNNKVMFYPSSVMKMTASKSQESLPAAGYENMVLTTLLFFLTSLASDLSKSN